MRWITVLSILFLGTAFAGQGADELHLYDLFPKKSYFGKTARNVAWSYDDRYIAYLWNPYDVKGWDIWLYDTKTGKSKRITSIELMANFDRDIPKIIERYKKEKEEEEKRKKLTREERRQLEREDDLKEEKRRKEEEKDPDKERQLDYNGISAFVWANKKHEILFEYRGDIFRYTIGDELPKQLTKTQERESNPKYTKDDSGFYLQRSTGVFKCRFDSPEIVQLNPKLPKNMSMGDYKLSPDESYILIETGRSTGPERQVTYITYRERFAEARTTGRSVADDIFKWESYMFIYDLNDDPKKNPKHDGKPWQIYYHPAGEEYAAVSMYEEPWSEDSKKVVFATWKRDKQEIEIIVADVEKKKVETVFKELHIGGPDTHFYIQPFFTPDGKKIVALLETSGYRHPWLIDPATKGATQITKGEFEVYPRKISKDGKTLFVTSWKEHSSRNDVYAVNMADGEMKRLTERVGSYGDPEISHDMKKFATSFKSWNALSELFVINPGHETPITNNSHSEEFWKLNKILPELFEYKNRHGNTIRGIIYHPPGWKKTDKRPLMIYVYGGPLGTAKDVVSGNFNLFNMYLAYKHGYVTVSIDPRGMSGYGALFERANWEAPGEAQVEDLTDGVKYLIENHGVDPEKVGINGWSFGGFQTLMCMLTAPDVFKLGIAGAGPTEWHNYNTWYTGNVIGKWKPDKKDEAELERHSILKYAKNLRGHLLLLHGVEDTNVLFQDTVKMYQAFLRAGKGPLVEIVIDPTGGHGLGGDIKTVDRLEIYEAFLMKHWGSYKQGGEER